MVFRKPNFGPPPEGYIAGLGRGASGFVTRGDVGPAAISMPPPGLGQASAGGPPGLAPPGLPPKAAPKEEREGNFDEWGGYEGSLVSGIPEDAEDQEADLTMAKLEDYMDNKRKRKEEQKQKEKDLKYATEKMDYISNRTELKKKLGDVSREEWESLPASVDLVKINKKKRTDSQRYMPVPDSVIASGINEGQSVNQIDPSAPEMGTEGLMSALGNDEAALTEIGVARQTLFSIELDRAQGKAGGSTTSINKEGYMTDLNSMKINSDTEINDIKKARALLKAVISSNPNSTSGWIAAARVEELDGKVQEARNILSQACEKFLDQEDVWLEAARLQPPEREKQFLAKAVQNIPHSKKLWMQAALKEDDTKVRSKIYRRALEYLPAEVDLWKAAIELEEPAEAKVMLYKAVQCVPQSTDLWLALAKLETYKNAQAVLNKARETIPTDSTIYVAAAKLEEASGNTKLTYKIINKAIKNLQKHQVNVSRDHWLRQAVIAEQADSLETCKAIIKETMHVGLEIDSFADQKERSKQSRSIWLQNIDACITNEGAIETARTIILNALGIYPEKQSLWMRAQKLESTYGTNESLVRLLTKGVETAKHEFLYILLARVYYKKLHQPDMSLKVLQQGLQEHDDSEDIVLAIQKLYRDQGKYSEAEEIINKALAENPSERLWMQAIQLQRELLRVQKALQLADQSLKTEFKDFYKLWLIKAQLLEQTCQYDEARKVYEDYLWTDGGKKEVVMWLQAALFEERLEAFTKARTILQKARVKMPEDPEIWLASIRLEIKCDNQKIAEHLLARALQACPESGRLWAQAVEMEPPATRLRKSTDAVNKVKTSPYIFLSIGKIFWVEKKKEKARRFLMRASELEDGDNGDAWIYLYNFEKSYGTPEAVKKVESDFRDKEPRHGELWCSEIKKVENWRRDKFEVLQSIKITLPLY